MDFEKKMINIRPDQAEYLAFIKEDKGISFSQQIRDMIDNEMNKLDEIQEMLDDRDRDKKRSINRIIRERNL